MFGYKSVVAAVTVATMVASSAFAADTLAPGKPAGVSKAQLQIGTGALIIGVGAAAVIAAVAITVSNNDQNNNSGASSTFAAPSTSATAP